MASLRRLWNSSHARFVENQGQSAPSETRFPLGGEDQKESYQKVFTSWAETVFDSHATFKLSNFCVRQQTKTYLIERMHLWKRIIGRYRREASRLLCRRMVRMQNKEPIISFTFDDFPRSSLYNAAPVFRSLNVKATYYASFGLMGKTTPTSEIFNREDLPFLLSERHEIGCHTFDHYDAFETDPAIFEASVQRNLSFLESIDPGRTMKTLSYPISGARPATKSRCANYFLACRSGGQTFNRDVADLNGLRAFFLEQCFGDFDSVKNLIDANFKARGWLILATHDISDCPTRYGCQQSFFEEVVGYARSSRSLILPMEAALNIVC